MQIPMKYQVVPPLVTQFAESMLNEASRADHRDNAKRTLELIRDFISWAIKLYDDQLLTSNTKKKTR